MLQHELSESCYPALQAKWSDWTRSKFCTKFHWRPIVRYLCQQIADTVYRMNARDDKLVWPISPIDDCPDKFFVVTFDDFKIPTGRLQSKTSPATKVR